MDRLRTSLCDLLGVEYPILQSGMGSVAGPELVAEVSRAGGLGILAALRLSADQVRTGIRRVRELTDRPFGVNLWLHTDIRLPVDPAKSAFTDGYAASGAPVLQALLQSSAAQDIYAAATKQQNREYFPMHAGQSVGMVHDLPGAAEVVETLVRETCAALRALGERVRLG